MRITMLKTFDEKTIQAVWNKGIIVPGSNPNLLRKDTCMAWIKKEEYGNRSSSYGWEIDHIKPVAAGGTDSLVNLRPLQWRNNASKSDGRLTCPVTAK